MAKYIEIAGAQIDSIQNQLSSAFSDKKLRIVNKSTILVPSGKVMAVVRLKKDRIKVNGDLNNKNPLIMIMIILGIILGFFGVILIAGVLYIIYARKIKELREEVVNVLQGI